MAQVEVRDTLDDPHPFVAKAKKLIDIRPGKVHDRALRVLDAIARSGADFGYELVIHTAKCKAELFKGEYGSAGDEMAMAFGELRICLEFSEPQPWILAVCAGKTQTKDGPKTNVESRLDVFLEKVQLFAETDGQDILETRRQVREAEAKWRREEAWRQSRADFKSAYERWRAARTQGRFLRAARERYLATHGRIDPDGEFAEWLAWAEAHVKGQDPFAELLKLD